MSTSAPWWEVQLRRHPWRVLFGFACIAIVLELLQYESEGFPGAHAGGEIVRNFAYALAGAQIFHLLIVELPRRRRQRITYDFCRQTMQVLTTFPAGLLKPYQLAAEASGFELDPWDQNSISGFADHLVSGGHDATFFNGDRTSMVKQCVETAFPRALAESSPSVAHLDTEVSHALSMFPRQEGLTKVLQLRLTPAGSIEPAQDAYITWTLLEAARGLYQALLAVNAYDSTFFQAEIGTPPNTIKLSDDVLLPRPIEEASTEITRKNHKLRFFVAGTIFGAVFGIVVALHFDEKTVAIVSGVVLFLSTLAAMTSYADEDAAVRLIQSLKDAAGYLTAPAKAAMLLIGVTFGYGFFSAASVTFK